MVSNILAPLDGTEIAEAGLCWAEHAARRSGAAVQLLTVVDPSEADASPRMKEAEAYLQSRRDRLKNKGLTVSMEVARGEPADTILNRAEAADLTVVSSGTVRWLISAVLDRVLERMATPLVVVRASPGVEPATPELGKILVALDQVEYSSEIVPLVQRIAKAFSAGVTLCHAIPPMVDADGRPQQGRTGGSTVIHEAELFVAAVAQEFEDQGIETESVVTIGDPPTQIVHTAQRSGAGLIALTTRGRDRLGSRMGGSTATAILHSTRLPCLLTRRVPAGAIPGGMASGTSEAR